VTGAAAGPDEVDVNQPQGMLAAAASGLLRCVHFRVRCSRRSSRRAARRRYSGRGDRHWAARYCCGLFAVYCLLIRVPFSVCADRGPEAGAHGEDREERPWSAQGMLLLLLSLVCLLLF
jgi:hypothetical protein